MNNTCLVMSIAEKSRVSLGVLIQKTWPLRLKWWQSPKEHWGPCFWSTEGEWTFPWKKKVGKDTFHQKQLLPWSAFESRACDRESRLLFHPAPTSFSFYLSPESFARSGLSLGSWLGNQACLPYPEADRRGQIGDEVTWDACEEGREPWRGHNRMTSLTPGGLDGPLVTGLM